MVEAALKEVGEHDVMRLQDVAGLDLVSIQGDGPAADAPAPCRFRESDSRPPWLPAS